MKNKIHANALMMLGQASHVVEDDEASPNVSEAVTAVATTLTVIPGPLTDVSAAAIAGTTDMELRWVGSIRNDISTVRIVWSHGEQERTLSHAAGVQTEIISGLQAELTYFFDFTITDNDGNTSVATRIFARTADITLPNPISGLSAATVLNTSDVTLSWTGSTSDDASMVYITWMPGDGERTLPHAAGMQTETISGLQSGIEYAFTLVVDDDATPPNLSDPATATITTATDSSNPDAVTMPQIVPLSSGTAVNITWVDSSSTDIASITVSWSTEGTMVGSKIVPMGQEAAIISGLTASTPYAFTITVADFADNMASTADLSVTTATPALVDADGDTLVDIDSLERLNNVRYNLDLADGYFKSNSVDDGIQCGVDSNIACTGYELTENLDFASAASYAAGTIDADWRPNGGTAASSTNAGWDPVGDCNADDDDNYSAVCGDSDDAPFNTLFEGNGNTISNIYARNISADTPAAIGLFGLTGAQAIIRNLGIAGGDFFGNGQNGDRVGALVGNMHDGVVVASHAINVSVHGRGGSDDRVGGLVGYNRSGSTIVSSYASGTADGGGARDSVGGLVGYNSGSILSSYATVNISESGGTHDRIGGLVGRNNGGAIIATYATGNVSGSNGNNDLVGGFVGYNTNRGDVTGFITASYATGNVNGGSGVRDRAAAFAGAQVGTVISSYGFGVATNGEIAGLHARLSGVTDTGIDGVRQLTTANTGELWAPPTWDLGTTAQAPILRYIDYDGDHTRFGCPGSNATIVVNCGDVLLCRDRVEMHCCRDRADNSPVTDEPAVIVNCGDALLGQSG